MHLYVNIALGGQSIALMRLKVRRLHMRRGLLLSSCVFGALLSGCATNSAVRVVRDQVEEVEQKAEEALSEARAAKRLAQEANDRSMRTEEMMNRSFKRSMYK
jgi:hypothetical protein